MEVEIWSDFLCPFCFIGKRNFEKALELFSEKDSVKVRFKCFELDPDAPKSQRIPIEEVLAKKYGKTLEWARKMNANVTHMAAQSGLEYHLDRTIPTNSFDAHRLSLLAATKGLQLPVMELLFEAYFREGQDLADIEVLKDRGAQAGLDLEEVERTLNTQAFAEEVRRDEEVAREFGIQGVPFFVFNGKFGVSGAQPTEVFLEVLNKAIEKPS